MDGNIFEGGCLDLTFTSKKHEIYIGFTNKYVVIDIDEETIDKHIQIKYSSVNSYYELEEKIYLAIIEYI